MFPFNTFFASFSPFFLRNKREELSLWRGMGYYFAVWGIITLFTIVMSLLVVWIFITPVRVAQWSAKIPEFSVTIQDGILTETGLTEDPYIPVDDQWFMVFISKTLTEIPEDKKRTSGIYILRDHVTILQAEWAGEKEQKISYIETPELKNLQFNKSILSRDIVSELPSIKRIASIVIMFTVFFVHIMVAIWYCVWSFFWWLVVWLFSRRQKNPFTYEQAVGFVLSVFFPVSIVSILLLVLWVWFPFFMTLLFLLALWYNHLSFYTGSTTSQ